MTYRVALSIIGYHDERSTLCLYCDRVCCFVLCLYTVMGWVAIPCVYIHVLYNGEGCRTLCLYTGMGWVSHFISVYCRGMIWLKMLKGKIQPQQASNLSFFTEDHSLSKSSNVKPFMILFILFFRK